jgi:hypothetical protein
VKYIGDMGNYGHKPREEETVCNIHTQLEASVKMDSKE